MHVRRDVNSSVRLVIQCACYQTRHLHPTLGGVFLHGQRHVAAAECVSLGHTDRSGQRHHTMGKILIVFSLFCICGGLAYACIVAIELAGAESTLLTPPSPAGHANSPPLSSPTDLQLIFHWKEDKLERLKRNKSKAHQKATRKQQSKQHKMSDEGKHEKEKAKKNERGQLRKQNCQGNDT